MSDRNDPIRTTADNCTPIPLSKCIFNGNTTRGGTKNNGSHALMRETDGDKPTDIDSAADALYFLRSHNAKNTTTIAARDDGKDHFFVLNKYATNLSIIIRIVIPSAAADPLLNDFTEFESPVDPPCKLKRPKIFSVKIFSNKRDFLEYFRTGVIQFRLISDRKCTRNCNLRG